MRGHPVRTIVQLLLATVAFVLPLHRLAVIALAPHPKTQVGRIAAPPPNRLRSTSLLVPRVGRDALGWCEGRPAGQPLPPAGLSPGCAICATERMNVSVDLSSLGSAFPLRC